MALHDEKVLLLFTAAQKSGVCQGGLRDAIKRGLEHFGERDINAYDAAAWADRLYAQAPHLYRQAEAEAPASPPTPASLTAEQLRRLQAMKPTERLTTFRQWQARRT